VTAFFIFTPMMQKRKTVCALALTVLILAACQIRDKASPPKSKGDEQISRDIDSLKKAATDGDLIVRLGDDMISYQIKFLNDSDRTYSHAGMIVEKDGRKWVTHITPEASGADTIQLSPIDSFITPGRNLRCALYRYDMSAAERDSLRAIVDRLRSRHVVFDRVYDFTTEDRMYCSEMISKSLHAATGGRLSFRTAKTPPNMVPLLVNYFRTEHLTKKIISERPFVTIDNLYRKPECRLVMQFPLKFFPGNEQ